MQVTPEVRKQVEAKVQECIDILMAKHNVVLPFPVITYNVRGTTAGYADYRKWHILLNPVLLMENIVEFIKRTVPHEMCHLAVDKIFPNAHRPNSAAKDQAVAFSGWARPKKRSLHGAEWQQLMRECGVQDITRCHKYDVTNARTRRGKAKYTYVCCGCGTKLELTGRRHTALQVNPFAVWHNGCKGHALTLESNVSVQNPIVPVVKKEAEPVFAGTKQARANVIVKAFEGCGRAAMIDKIMAVLSVSKAHASTLYYNATKK